MQLILLICTYLTRRVLPLQLLGCAKRFFSLPCEVVSYICDRVVIHLSVSLSHGKILQLWWFLPFILAWVINCDSHRMTSFAEVIHKYANGTNLDFCLEIVYDGCGPSYFFLVVQGMLHNWFSGFHCMYSFHLISTFKSMRCIFIIFDPLELLTSFFQAFNGLLMVAMCISCSTINWQKTRVKVCGVSCM